MTTNGPGTVDVSILVTTFRRPRHLALVLESIALQRLRGTTLEVVVSDDGSGDDTPHVVRAFATSSGVSVRYVSHPHDGFRLARARNAAARAMRCATQPPSIAASGLRSSRRAAIRLWALNMKVP